MPNEKKMAQIKSPAKTMKLNTEHNFSFEIIFLAIFVEQPSRTAFEYIIPGPWSYSC